MSQYPSPNDINSREQEIIKRMHLKMMNDKKNALHSKVVDSPNQSNNEDCDSSENTSDDEPQSNIIANQ